MQPTLKHIHTQRKKMNRSRGGDGKRDEPLTLSSRKMYRKKTNKDLKCTLDQVDKVKFRTWAVVTAQRIQGLPQAQGPEFESSVNPVLQQRAGGMRQNNLW